MRECRRESAPHPTFACHGPVRRRNHNRSHAGPALRSARLLRPQRGALWARRELAKNLQRSRLPPRSPGQAHEHPPGQRSVSRRVDARARLRSSHGELMVNVSLQGAQAGYDKSVNGIDRENAYRLGPGRGAYVSAFRPDGSLKPHWLARLEGLLRAAVNITDWLIAHDFRNLIVDVASEEDLAGPRERFEAEKR